MWKSIVGSTLFLAFSLSSDAQTAASTKAAALSADFSVTLLDGKKYQGKAQRGKYLLVNYWATWCKPCIVELPEFQGLANKRKDLAVIGLAYEEIEDKELKAFLQKLKITFPISKVDVYAAPPVGKEAPKGLPMTYVFGPDGQLIKSFLGPVKAKDIEALLPKQKS